MPPNSPSFHLLGRQRVTLNDVLILNAQSLPIFSKAPTRLQDWNGFSVWTTGGWGQRVHSYHCDVKPWQKGFHFLQKTGSSFWMNGRGELWPAWAQVSRLR